MGEPRDRPRDERPTVEFNWAVRFSICFVVFGCLMAFTGLAQWESAAIAVAAAATVEFTGQWWYGRKLA